MIGLDTNVLVRFLVGDDDDQFASAQRLVANLTPAEPGYLSIVTIVETFWVLTRGYKLPAAEVARTLKDVVERDDVATQDKALVTRALERADDGVDFTDALIMLACTSAGAHSVVTFDRRAAKELGMTLLT